jgi:toxin CcdB
MARFDVYAAGDHGWWLDVQTDLLGGLNSRVVVPLMPLQIAPKPARNLNPLFEIQGETVSMVTQYMASVPESALEMRVTSLDCEHDRITRALEMIFFGF